MLAYEDDEIYFDLAIFDEAHKTVGQVGKQFSQMILDSDIRIKHRLFMTATPKMYAKSNNEEEDDIISMDDAKYYGEKIYTYNTGNAIIDKRLSD
jgi:predicted helicase